jgi:hypothetical protein
VWQYHAPRTTLRGPSPETRKFLVAQRSEAEGDGRSLVEYLRRDAQGRVVDTRYRLVSEEEMNVSYDPYTGRDNGPFGFFGGFAPWGGPPPARPSGGFFGFNPPQAQPQPQPQPLPPRQAQPQPPRQYERPLWRGD